jgi:putative endonuclease
MTFFVYILKCNDNTLYCGYTNNLENRLKVHNGTGGQGTGAKYTRARRPVTLVYSEEYSSRSAATKREAEIKKLTRDKKLQLISR